MENFIPSGQIQKINPICRTQHFLKCMKNMKSWIPQGDIFIRFSRCLVGKMTNPSVSLYLTGFLWPTDRAMVEHRRRNTMTTNRSHQNASNTFKNATAVTVTLGMWHLQCDISQNSICRVIIIYDVCNMLNLSPTSQTCLCTIS